MNSPHICFVTEDDFNYANSVEHFEYEPRLDRIGPKCWAFDGYVIVRYDGKLNTGFGGEWNIIAKSDDETVEVLYFKQYHRNGNTRYYRSSLKEFNGDTTIEVVPLSLKYADTSFVDDENLREELESTAEECAVLLKRVADLNEENKLLVDERHTLRDKQTMLEMEVTRLEENCKRLQDQVDGGHKLLDEANARTVEANKRVSESPHMIRANNEIANLLTEIDRLNALDEERVKEHDNVALQNELIKKRNRKLIAHTDHMIRRNDIFKDFLEYQAGSYYDDIGTLLQAMRTVVDDISTHMNLHGIEAEADKALCIDIKNMVERVIADTVNLDTLQAHRKIEFFYHGIDPDTIKGEWHIVPGEPLPLIVAGVGAKFDHQTLITHVPNYLYVTTGASVDKIDSNRYKVDDESLIVNDVLCFGEPELD